MSDKAADLLMQLAELVDRMLADRVLAILFVLAVIARGAYVYAGAVPADAQGWILLAGDALTYGIAAAWGYEKRPKRGA